MKIKVVVDVDPRARRGLVIEGWSVGQKNKLASREDMRNHIITTIEIELGDLEHRAHCEAEGVKPHKFGE